MSVCGDDAHEDADGVDEGVIVVVVVDWQWDNLLRSHLWSLWS